MSERIDQNDEQQNKTLLPPRKRRKRRPSLLSICWSVFIVFLIFLGIWLKIIIPPPKSNVYNARVDWTTLGINEAIPKNIKEGNLSHLKTQSEVMGNVRKDPEHSERKETATFLKKMSVDDKLPASLPSEPDVVKKDVQQERPLSAEGAVTLPQSGLCIILSGVGLKSEYDSLIENRLMPEINIAVLPFKPSVTDKVKEWTRSAHEVITEIPMESLNYPAEDPGENTLLTGLKANENISRLEGFLARTPGVRGILSLNGTRFTAVRRDIAPIIRYLKSKNLLFVDSVTTPHSQVDEVSALLKSPFMAVTVTIPIETDSETAWKMILAEAEKSLKHGLSVVKIDVSPKRLNDLIGWQDKLKQDGVRLYKVSEASDLLKKVEEKQEKTSPVSPIKESQYTEFVGKKSVVESPAISEGGKK